MEQRRTALRVLTQAPVARVNLDGQALPALIGAEIQTAFESATARGEGVAVLNGRIIENLHVASARRLLARAAAIAAMASGS